MILGQFYYNWGYWTASIREKKEIAKAFKKQNVAEDIIAICTGLNIEEIKAIKIDDK